jgi:hypothetical protein
VSVAKVEEAGNGSGGGGTQSQAIVPEYLLHAAKAAELNSDCISIDTLRL